MNIARKICAGMIVLGGLVVAIPKIDIDISIRINGDNEHGKRAYAAEITMKERVRNIYKDNPFSQYYEPPKAVEMGADEPTADEYYESALMLEEDNAVEESSADEVGDEIDKILKTTKENRKKLKAMIERWEDLAEQTKKMNDEKEKSAQKAEESEASTDTKPASQTYEKPAYQESSKIYLAPQVEIKEKASLDILENNELSQNNELYIYKKGKSYDIYASPGFLTDIQLMPGERIVDIAVGDKARWHVQPRKLETDNMWHVFVKPLNLGCTSNMVIQTTKHNYHLHLVADTEYMPVVAWTYPGESIAEHNREGVTVEVESVDKLNFDYKVTKGKKYPWTPIHVYDDGFNTYLTLEGNAANKYVPAIFQKRESGQLIHLEYKIVNSTIIVDRVCNELVMVMDDSKKCLIKKAGN